jgi:carboxyl-terminal processing protease
VLTNQGGTPTDTSPAARTELPPIASSIPKLPPEGWPAFDPAKPDTDFQLQQGLVVVRAMAAQAQRHANR